MNLFLNIILYTTIIGLSYSATITANPQCSLCKATVDWVRSNENVLSEIKNDEVLSKDFIELIDSDLAAESACGLLTMCETNDEASEYLTNFRGGRGGGRGGSHGGGHHTHVHVHGHDIACALHNNC